MQRPEEKAPVAVDESEFLTPMQLSVVYPISRSTIYAACSAGLLPHYRLPARAGSRGKYLIRLPDFMSWIEGHRHEGGSTTPLNHIKPR